MAMVGMVSAELGTGKVAAIEARAKALLESAVGRPCVRMMIGPRVILTEWLTAGDAARASTFFSTEMGKVTRLSYDTRFGWLCEAAEAF